MLGYRGGYIYRWEPLVICERIRFHVLVMASNEDPPVRKHFRRFTKVDRWTSGQVI